MQAQLSTAQGAIIASRVERRMFVQTTPPAWPFVWRGLLPLLGLIGLCVFAELPFAREDIEAVVQSETRAQLDARGFNWADLKVSGQNVTLSGTPPTAADGDAALDAARAANCPTWLGRKTCAVVVNGEFSSPAKAAAPMPTPTPAPAVVAPAEAAKACEKTLADTVARSSITFDTGSATIQGSSASVLDALAATAKDCPGTLRIEGHTDDVGSPDRNLRLSQARAASVRNALAARGVPDQRMASEGYGQTRPVAPNIDAPGRAANRRIEFKVVTGL